MCSVCGQIYAKVGLYCALKRVHLHSWGMTRIHQIGICLDLESSVSTQTRHSKSCDDCKDFHANSAEQSYFTLSTELNIKDFKFWGDPQGPNI